MWDGLVRKGMDCQSLGNCWLRSISESCFKIVSLMNSDLDISSSVAARSIRSSCFWVTTAVAVRSFGMYGIWLVTSSHRSSHTLSAASHSSQMSEMDLSD